METKKQKMEEKLPLIQLRPITEAISWMNIVVMYGFFCEIIWLKQAIDQHETFKY
jgi:hypothetical protein